MLDERIVALARRTAGPQLRDLDEPLARGAEGIKRKHRGAGALFLYMMDLYKQEVRRRAEIIWRNLHRAHSATGAPHTDTLLAELAASFREQLSHAINELRPRFDKDMQGAPTLNKEPDWVAQLETAHGHEIARYEAEIDQYVTARETQRARGATPAVAYNFHGAVGAVMTGPGAVANVVQNIGPAERENLQQALALVRETISQAPELADRDRNELTELTDEASAEIAKEQPNTKRLLATLKTLSETVQGIAAGPGAYEALRVAAAAIGITF